MNGNSLCGLCVALLVLLLLCCCAAAKAAAAATAAQATWWASLPRRGPVGARVQLERSLVTTLHVGGWCVSWCWLTCSCWLGSCSRDGSSGHMVGVRAAAWSCTSSLATRAQHGQPLVHVGVPGRVTLVNLLVMLGSCSRDGSSGHMVCVIRHCQGVVQ